MMDWVHAELARFNMKEFKVQARERKHFAEELTDKALPNESHAQARTDIFDCIDCFCNPRRKRKAKSLKLKKSNWTQPSLVSGLCPTPRDAWRVLDTDA